MKNKLWKCCIAVGVLMILGSLALCVMNIRESRKAGAYSQSVLTALKKQIPVYTEPTPLPETHPRGENLFDPYETQTTEPVVSMPEEIVIDDHAYCGYISIPSVHIELPVLSEWNESNLKTAPCRYSGAAETGNLILAGHNYRTHFGPLHSLRIGEPVIWTDVTGKTYRYTVSDKEEISGSDSAGMNSGAAEQWDLTLFTCTIGGKSRVTVRARLDQPAA